MDRGKRPQVDPVPDKAERRQIKAQRDYEIITQQFWPLMGKIDGWLEQHRAPEGQEEIQASDAEDGTSTTQACSEGLADTILGCYASLMGKMRLAGVAKLSIRSLRLPLTNQASGSGQAVDQKPEVAFVDQKPEVALLIRISRLPPSFRSPAFLSLRNYMTQDDS